MNPQELTPIVASCLGNVFLQTTGGLVQSRMTAFALFTDDDFSGFGTAGATEELPLPADDPLHCPDWPLENVGIDAIEPVQEMLDRQWAHFYEVNAVALDRGEDDVIDLFAAFRDELVAATLTGFELAIESGAFGIPSERDGLLLLFDMSDSELAMTQKKNWLRRLNTKAVIRRFSWPMCLLRRITSRTCRTK